MKTSMLSLAALAAVAIAPAHTAAQNAPNTATLAAAPTTVTFGGATVLTGQVTGADNAGVKLALEEDAFPFDGFKNTGTQATTDSSGNFTFTVKPALLTRYQVTSKGKTQVTSPAVEVKVRPLVTLAVNDATARRGQRITFSGTVSPAHDGGKVKLQRKIGRGSFRTIATLTLVKSTTAGQSTFTHRARVRRTAVYRVRTIADADHVVGTSPKRKVRVR